MSIWLVGSGVEFITMMAVAYSEEEADEMVDSLITEDYEFKGVTSTDSGYKLYEWRHPNGEIVRQMGVVS